MANKQLKIALVGNPNSGKSTLFNILTGLNQKIANFPGVTVEKKTGFCALRNPVTQEGIDAEIIDLPGTYSLYPKSPDERIPFQALCDPANEAHPDLTIVIADASNLKRSLFLCTQVIDLGHPALLVLNMMDLVKARGQRIDVGKLSQQLGIRVVPVNARKKEGIEELKDIIAGGPHNPSRSIINVYPLAPALLDQIKSSIRINNDYIAFQLANNIEHIEMLRMQGFSKDILRNVLAYHKFESKKLQAQETLERYTHIGQIVEACIIQDNKPRISLTDKLDRLLTHRILGFVFFLLVMFLMFQAVFSWSEYPMQLVEEMFLLISGKVQAALPEGWLSDLLVNGILAGLSGIVVFVPQIALLFTFIAILEDSGYMARVSFIMDKMMRKFGLNGKSVIPLISGVACAVPAIMSTRTIQNWKERILTIMVTPLMSCSARIPVYALLISLVIPDKAVFGIFNLQGLMLMGLYLLGAFTAIASAWILKFFVKGRERSYFIMEMPLYRMPRWNNIALSIVDRVKVFLFDAGKVIIAISIVLWVLSSYGPGSSFEEIEKKYGKLAELSPAGQPQDSTVAELSSRIQSEKLSASYAGRIGKWMEPAIEPLGFDWKIGIALVTSFAAREVFVGTMATIYSAGADDTNTSSVREKMRQDRHPETGAPVYTMATGVSLMLFYAFAMQCMSTISIVYRETKNFKWPFLQLLYMSALAYFASLLAYQLLK
jgi:ferrous iron transport protein B